MRIELTSFQTTQLVEEARSWIGTKWKHGQNQKGVGVDCVQFVYEVGKTVGMSVEPPPEKYAPICRGNEIYDYLTRNCSQIDTMRTSAILLFKVKGFLTHLGMATSPTHFIHASLTDGRVIEEPFNGKLANSLHSIWFYKWQK